MNDLNVISRKNSEAVEAYAAKEAEAGKWVLLKYTGLHFVDYSAFDNERDRNAAAIEYTNAAPSNRSGSINPAK